MTPFSAVRPSTFNRGQPILALWLLLAHTPEKPIRTKGSIARAASFRFRAVLLGGPPQLCERMSTPLDDHSEQRASTFADAPPSSELLASIYDELHALASAYLRNERSAHTLQTTALVHEAWLRLSGRDSSRFSSRAHFFSRRGPDHAPHPADPRGAQAGAETGRRSERRVPGRRDRPPGRDESSRRSAHPIFVIHYIFSGSMPFVVEIANGSARYATFSRVPFAWTSSAARSRGRA